MYLYSALHYVTNSGRDIRLAQYLFVVLYVCFTALVALIYSKSKPVREPLREVVEARRPELV